jgi:hypothetical protein
MGDLGVRKVGCGGDREGLNLGDRWWMVASR